MTESFHYSLYFSEALKWLKKGKKITRPSWKEDYWVFLGKDKEVLIGNRFSDTSYRWMPVSLEAILADDWDILE